MVLREESGFELLLTTKSSTLDELVLFVLVFHALPLDSTWCSKLGIAL